MNKTWKNVSSRSIKNLWICVNEGEQFDNPYGFIEKPEDKDGDKNAWRAYLGVGSRNQFLGHAWDKRGAQLLVLAAITGQEAFDRSSQCVPARCPKLAELLKGSRKLAGELIRAWLTGWNKANIDAPVPGWSAEENAALRRAHL